MKKCSSCKKIKNLFLFNRQNNRKDGRRSICKECQVIYNRRYSNYTKNYCKKWNIKNKEKVARYKKEKAKRIKKETGFSEATINRFGLHKLLFVYERDGYKCKQCGNKNGLGIHHLDGSGKTKALANDDVENLIVLCRKCHPKIHVKRIIEFNGKKQTIKQWSMELGISQATIYTRLYRNECVEKALTVAKWSKRGYKNGKAKKDKMGYNSRDTG